MDLATWKTRPNQDAAFRQRIVGYAMQSDKPELARRLEAERDAFRVKPWEVCGSATHNRHPVKFRQAVKLAKIVTKLVRRQQLSTAARRA